MQRSDLVRLYPSRWRRRYEVEFCALLEEERWSARLFLDVAVGALAARLGPYPAPTLEDRAMTARRTETAAAFLAAVLVLPALLLLASAAVRLMQPTQYQPAHAADAIFTWFTALHAGGAILVAGPVVALALGLAAVWRRLAADADLRADIGLFLEVTSRLLRRPVLVAGSLAALGSLVVLVFMLDHAIAG